MNILLFGANGQLGQSFTDYFIKNSINFYASDITNKSKYSVEIAYIKSDITDLAAVLNLSKLSKFTHIINCSAYNLVDKAETDWQNAYKINGIGPKIICLLANKLNADLVHYSTDYVFDGKKNTPYTIFDNPGPINKYGESKLLGERYVQTFSSKFYLIRTSWVFGNNGNNFIDKVVSWSQKTETIKFTEDEVSSPTYTEDLVIATMQLIKTNNYGLYHISNTSCSRYEWGKFILDCIKWNGKIERAKQIDFGLPAKRPIFSVLNNFGLEEAVKWTMPDWQDATKRYLQILRRERS